MHLQFKKITVEEIPRMLPYYNMRRNNTCDSVFLESFLWKDFYNVRYAIWEDRALLWLMEANGKCFSAMPLCREEDLPEAFHAIETYFNEVLGFPLVINLADEYAVKYLDLPPENYLVREQEDSRDYLYLGESMRKLSGRKLHKKKNRLNAFLRQYEGRFEYRKLTCAEKDDMWRFLDKWRLQKGDDVEEHLDYEVQGIHDILRNCSRLDIRMGGIYVDQRLEAFSLGSYNPIEDMAVIHIEKANPEINGLYQAINQLFLINEFPNVKWVNREDDMGLEGLRKAKMSYNPADFARKYLVEQLTKNKKSYRWTEQIENTAAANSVEYLCDNEKSETIPLWKACFPEDTDRYLDYYYHEKTLDNKILAIREEGRILSMLHRNPYKLRLGDITWDSDYIVAVATDKAHRGRGYMREILTKALKDMHQEGIPFTFLMPASEAIYTPFDFRYIWDAPSLSRDEDSIQALTAKAITESEQDCQIAAKFMNSWLSKHAQLHTVRDHSYIRRLLRELKSEDGELLFLYRGDQLVGLQAVTGEKKDQRLLYTDSKWYAKGPSKPLIMARITNIQKFLEAISLRESGTLDIKLKVEDRLLPENAEEYLWHLDEKGSSLSIIKDESSLARLSDQKIWPLQAEIADLASWLFGYQKLTALWKLSPQLKSELNKIQPIQGVWLDEIV